MNETAKMLKTKRVQNGPSHFKFWLTKVRNLLSRCNQSVTNNLRQMRTVASFIKLGSRY